MAYFNHAFRKTFLSTGPDVTAYTVSLIDGSTVAAGAQKGFVISPNLPTYGLNVLSQAVDSGAIAVTGAPSQNNGFVGIFNTKTHLSLEIAIVGKECCPF